MAHADRVIPRDQIFRAVWGQPSGDGSNTLAVHIKRLRQRLGDDHKNPHIIATVRSVGYRLIAPTPTPG